MCKEILDEFIQQISDSEELLVRVGDVIDADAFIALGAEHGCEFSAEDLAENAELSDEELDGVAGGVWDVIQDGVAGGVMITSCSVHGTNEIGTQSGSKGIILKIAGGRLSVTLGYSAGASNPYL